MNQLILLCLIVTVCLLKISTAFHAPQMTRSFSTVRNVGGLSNNRHFLQKFNLKMASDVNGGSNAVVTSTPTKAGFSLWNAYLKITDTLTILFPLWTVIFAGLAIVRPESFAWFTTQYFTGTLGLLMLSMGITLTVDDFKRVLQQPTAVIWGFILCYVMCPILALGLGRAFKLPIDLVAGLVLVGSINGGQASNLCTYIAKGDVALSVLMTTVTTIAGYYFNHFFCILLTFL